MKRKMRVFVVITCCAVVCAGGLVFGGSKPQRREIYEIVEIQKGDTVWEIAQQFNRGDMTTRKYTEYIMNFNDMTTPMIQPGQHIIVPVFVEDKQ